MVCGTTSNAGKTTLVAAMCRYFSRRGIRVAPFKAQNMSNNSAVTLSGHEIARAQAWQAMAARTEAEVTMNPVLLKPTGPNLCQVIVMGRPLGAVSAAGYHRRKPELLQTVLAALRDLRERYDVVLLEGAGSPAEINLLESDIVNLRLAHEAGVPAILVGDINLGGVFASLYGTVALLPEEQRRQIKAFVINKFRGDPALLFDGTGQLERRSSVPTIGVLPWLDGPEIDSEDSLALEQPFETTGGQGVTTDKPFEEPLDVAVVKLPHIANFTDLDPLRIEQGVVLRWVDHGRSLGQPDLLVIPGSKATVADLDWLRRQQLDKAIAAIRGTVLGVCAGYQILGRSISDPHRVESDGGSTSGLGLLDAETEFGPTKVTRRGRGEMFGQEVRGYHIHHGIVHGAGPGLVDIGGSAEGAVGATPAGGTVWGTSLHGLLESDGARRALLEAVALQTGKRFHPSGCFEDVRQERIDRLADALEAHVDMAALDRIIAGGSLPPG